MNESTIGFDIFVERLRKR